MTEGANMAEGAIQAVLTGMFRKGEIVRWWLDDSRGPGIEWVKKTDDDRWLHVETEQGIFDFCLQSSETQPESERDMSSRLASELQDWIAEVHSRGELRPMPPLPPK